MYEMDIIAIYACFIAMLTIVSQVIGQKHAKKNAQLLQYSPWDSVLLNIMGQCRVIDRFLQ